MMLSLDDNSNRRIDQMNARRKLQFGFVTWSCCLFALAMAIPEFSPESASGRSSSGIQIDTESIAIQPITLSTKTIAKKQSSVQMARRGRSRISTTVCTLEIDPIVLGPLLQTFGISTAIFPATIGSLLADHQFRRGPPPNALHIA